MSIVKTLIVNADAECRYLTLGEVDQIKMPLKGIAKSIRAMKTVATALSPEGGSEVGTYFDGLIQAFL
ncbi:MULTISPECIES: hypothetical protein [Cyanophyceae]|uniref:hypothetical protein n=1 Tax=Cyanophyceae TaxID=3028117 RepID=UPI00168A02A8|nr:MULTISPECIES: hypothetical protein [unclassified Phormidium]MBD1915250.1 hypothetical protein [Phormidium sp. FACHB-77]MBD2032473.1 hypothetical protein [Phormidium sp. FACHB-322]MBD2050996.1 hypothetical protein [Leptolyngbya sp. FACHB-60]